LHHQARLQKVGKGFVVQARPQDTLLRPQGSAVERDTGQVRTKDHKVVFLPSLGDVSVEGGAVSAVVNPFIFLVHRRGLAVNEFGYQFPVATFIPKAAIN
jgi:hypothetical protein